MRTRVIVKGQRDSKIDSVIEKLKPVLSELGGTLDASIKSALLESNIELQRLGKFVFCSIDSVGITICSGHIDGLYAKLFNAYSLYKFKKIDSLILIAKTQKETWWNHQEAQIRKGKPLVNNDGNRQSWGDIKDAITSSTHWYDIPITALVVERKLSAEKYDKFEW